MEWTDLLPPLYKHKFICMKSADRTPLKSIIRNVPGMLSILLFSCSLLFIAYSNAELPGSEPGFLGNHAADTLIFPSSISVYGVICLSGIERGGE